MFNAIGVFVDQVNFKDVGRRVIRVCRNALLGVDFGALQVGLKPCVFTVSSQKVGDPVTISAVDHVHGDFEALANVNVHHIA